MNLWRTSRDEFTKPAEREFISLANFSLPGDLSPSSRYWATDIVSPEWTMDARGMVHVPREAPGLGVAVDANRIGVITTRREVLRPPRRD